MGTGRILPVPIREHLDSKRRGALGNPLGKHRVDVYGGDDFGVKCKILVVEEEKRSGFLPEIQ